MRRPLGSMMAVLALAAISSMRDVRADVPPPTDSPESKRVPATIELDWGVFAERVSRRHVIAAGETLRSIATKQLGNASRVKAIVEANTDVVTDPDRIRVGDVLWLPPSKSLEFAAKAPTAPAPTSSEESATPELSPWYDAFWLETPKRRGGPPSPLVIEARATPGEPAKPTLLLVPHAAAGAMLAAITSGPVPINLGEVKGTLTVGMWSDTLVHRDDPTVKVVTTYKLTGASGTSLTTDIARVRYDAAGRVVTKEWVVPKPSYDFEKPVKAPPPAAPSPGPSPIGPSGPESPPNPTPADPAMTTPLTVTSSGAVTETAPSPADDGTHWPASTGLIVALVGAAAVAGLWIYRRSRVPTPPPSA